MTNSFQLQASLLNQWTRPLGRGAALEVFLNPKGNSAGAAAGSDIANRGLCCYDVSWEPNRPTNSFTASLIVSVNDNFASFLRFDVPQMSVYVTDGIGIVEEE